MNEELLTVSEFCKAAKISRATFYVLRREGKAPVNVKVGKRTLISRQSFENWIADLEAASVNNNRPQMKKGA